MCSLGETPVSGSHLLQFTGDQFDSHGSGPRTSGGPYLPPTSIHGADLWATWAREYNSDLDSYTYRVQLLPPSLKSTTGASSRQRALNPFAMESSHETECVSILHDSSEPYNVGEALQRPERNHARQAVNSAMETVASKFPIYDCQRCDKSCYTKEALQ